MKPRWRPPVQADLASSAPIGTVAVSATAASAATPTILCRAAGHARHHQPAAVRQPGTGAARSRTARPGRFSRSDSGFVNTSYPSYAASGNTSQVVEAIDNNLWKRLRCNTDDGAIGVAPDGTTRFSVNA